jgi:hypothetical protein
MLLKPETRQIFVDLKCDTDSPNKDRVSYGSKACNKLKNDSWDDEFLISRILFLTTYGTNINLTNLVDQNGLADILVQKMSRHAKRLTEKQSKAKVDPMEGMALLETLKLMFNLSHFCSDRVSSLTPTVPHIATILLKNDISKTKPLDHPFRDLINALLNLDLDDKELQSALYPRGDSTAVCQRLIEILDHSLRVYDDNELEQSVTPLVGVIRKLHASPNMAEPVRQYIRETLLPTEEDRRLVLGKGQTFPARLLRSSTNAMTPQLRDAVQHLLFDMSDKDASKFVENVGYGFASGFLFQNGMPVPASAKEAHATGDAMRPVNPVTGQFLDAEAPIREPEMTEEEKEREAEKLFVLFERYSYLYHQGRLWS